MLDYQQWLGRTAVVWSSPVFIGVAMICVWLYRERTLASAVTVGGLTLAAWVGGGVLVSRAVGELGRRKRQLEDVLADL